MKVLIYGSRAWIGNMILKEFESNNIPIFEGLCRVDNINDLEEEIQRIAPTHVIATIGRTHGTYNNKVYGTIDYLEQPGKLVENVRDNLFAQTVLSIMATKHNYHLTVISTGCIYTYDENHPVEQEVNGFKEHETPNFTGSGYSTVKGYTDQILNLYKDKVLSCRIRMPITHEKENARNFIYKITHYEKICSIKNSMTVLNDFVPLIVDMMKKNITGPVNCTNPGLISHNEILEMYKEIVDPTFTWNNFTIEEQNEILDSGRSNNYLDTTLLESYYPTIKTIKESVKDILVKMSSSIQH